MELRVLVGQRIRSLRRAAGHTQRDLADALGRQEETISAIERGLNLPSEDTLIGLSRVLDVPVHAFFEVGDISAKDREREALISEVLALCRQLPKRDLEIALRQLEAFAPRTPPEAL